MKMLTSKIPFLLLMFMILCPGMIVTVQGVDFPEAEQALDAAEAYGVDSEGGFAAGVEGLLEVAGDGIGALIGQSAASGLKLMAVVLLCSMAQGVGQVGESGGLAPVEMGGSLAITALTLRDMEGLIGLGRETMERLDNFAGVLLPAVATLTAASGAVTSAALRQGVTVLCCDLLISAMDVVLIPMVYGYVALCCAHAALDNPGLKKMAELVKGAAVLLLTAALLAFVGYLTASGAIAGSVDAAAVKTAKIAISRTVPVVGAILADSAEVVLAGAGVLRGTVGAAGTLAVLAICLTPFLQLGLHYLMYKAAAAITATIASPRLSGLLDQVGGAFGLVLGMVGAGALVLLFSVVSALSAVTAS